MGDATTGGARRAGAVLAGIRTGATSLGTMASRRIPTMDFTQAAQSGRFARAETFPGGGTGAGTRPPSCRRISAGRRASPAWRRWPT